MINSYHGNTSNEQGILFEHIYCIVSLIFLYILVANANHLVQMTTSLIENIKNCENLMSQSADDSNVNCSNSKMNNSQDSTPRTTTPNPYNGME